ncbi:hypothetical protein ACSBR1_008059 [Camellia fascicularis]
MTSLRVFDASFNNLNSSMPKELFNLNGLISLRLGYNFFQGPIPIGHLNTTSLRDLYLGRNGFKSSIPNGFYSFSHLESLDLRDNLLQGVISSAIGNLTSLVSLDLSSNQHEGRIPTSMGQLCKKMATKEKGGWIPVIRRRGGMIGNRSSAEGVFTLFVDDIPNSMDPKRLFSLFGKFGLVKDVFIPAKRRKGTGTRFGFVRYTCSVAADMAIQKADGLWCDNKALRVKKAEYQKGEWKVERDVHRGKTRTVRKVTGQQVLPQIGVKNQGRRSYAEVVQGGTSSENERLKVKVTEAGNGWLYESLLVVLKSFLDFNEFKDEVKARMKGVRVRSGGGRLAVLTFNSKQQMNDERARMDEWIFEWSDSITEWGKGKFIGSERCVWITCMGVPLNVWSVKTFRAIGSLWGEVVQLDEAINDPYSFQYGKLCKLKGIDLSFNKFGGEVGEVFRSFSRCKSDGLEMVHLENNYIFGQLPDEFGQLKNLADLSLSGNSISGPIPISIGRLSSLTTFDISYNQLNGTLPENLGQLVKLETLIISHNFLMGIVLDIHFANLTRLNTLYGDGNSLTLKVSDDSVPPFQLGYLSLIFWQLGTQFPLWLQSTQEFQIPFQLGFGPNVANYFI